MAGVQAGRLSIEIVAEIARLQTDLDKAKRAVKAMSNDIARDTKAANDNIARLGTGFANTGRVVSTSAGNTRAAMQQLSFQLGDIAQGFALGTRPMTIFAQQSGQVIQALGLMTNSTKGFLGFMAGPWGLIISAAAVVLVPLIGKLLDAEQAIKEVEFASYKLGDAQSILGNVMDLTTGKIKTQTGALIALAQAQLIAGQIKARAEQAEARSELVGIRKGSVQLTGGLGGGVGLTRVGNSNIADIVSAFQDGSLSTREAERGLRSLLKTGMATEQEYLDAAAAVTKFGVAAANLKVFEDAEKGLNGDRGALAQFLDPAKAARNGARERKPKSGPSAEDIERRFQEQRQSYAQQTLSAMLQLATSAEERAELESRALELGRIAQNAQIDADKNFTAAQKARLHDAVEELAEYQRKIVERRKLQQLDQEAQQVARAMHDASTDALQTQLALAGTEAERKTLALQIFDAETAYLRSKLEALATSELISENERKLAQIQLDALNANAGGKREAVGKANATSVEKYLAELNVTTAQLDEQFNKVTTDGLNALGDGILDVITGVKSLGDAFRQVTNQIIADLLRIAIQQMIVKPIANAIFPGIGGNAYGTSYWSGGPTWVGEDGPEIVNLPQGASITPSHKSANDNGRGGSVHFHFPNVTNAREAREAGAQAARRYRRELNGPV